MAENDPIAFDLSVKDGRGLLLLVDRTLHGWLKVARLELEIPELAFPLDVAGGPVRFQRRRCRLRAAELVLDDGALAELLRARGAALGAAGFDEVRARVLEGTIELSGRARRGERRAELTVRAQLREDGRGVRVTAVEPRLYGSLLRPAALVAHDLLTALTRDDERAAARGLGEVVLQPLDTFLWETLPAAGWRLPDATKARVLGLATLRGRIELRFGEGSFGEGTNPDAAREVLRAGDERLLAGDPPGALL